VPHTAGAQQRTSPAAPAQPRSSGNSPMLWMQPGGGGGSSRDHQPFLPQPTPFQAMQQMQLDGGMLAQQRAMIRQQVQAQQVRILLLSMPVVCVSPLRLCMACVTSTSFWRHATCARVYPTQAGDDTSS